MAGARFEIGEAMMNLRRSPRHLLPALGGALAVLAGCAPEGAATTAATATTGRGLPGDGLVISAVYGAGNLGGATFRNDFVELFNRSADPVPLGGLSIQYGSAAGNFANNASSLIVLPATATVAPGAYFLISLSGGTANGVALPAADLVNAATDMSGTNGKVALARITTALGCGMASRCPLTNIVDMVGWGTANDYEGTAAMGALSMTRSGVRRLAGCQDTNLNSADFEVANPAAVPRNSASPLNVCAATPLDAGVIEDAGEAPVDAAAPDAVVVLPDATTPADTGVVVNPDAAVVAPDAAADDAAVVVNPDATVVAPDAAADDAAVVAPDAAADDAAVVVNPDAAVVAPDASDDAGVIVIVDASDDAGAADPDAGTSDPDAGDPTDGGVLDPNAGAGLVISQVYGAGGNTGAVFTHDFVELFNTTSASIALDGLSIQYGSAAGNYANPLANGMPGTGLTVLPHVGVGPGQYFLVRMAGGANGTPITTFDFEGPSNLSGTNGKVALVRGSASVGCGTMPCDPAVFIDRVGYGTANDFEGSAAAAALTPTTALLRAGNGCVDTNDNASDLAAGTPLPRDRTQPINDCTVVSTDAGVSTDADLPDAQPVTDSGMPVDSGAPDTGVVVMPDSGVVTPDTGVVVTPDSGVATPDSGVVATGDAGSSGGRDASVSSRDAGGGIEQEDSGCGCSSSPGADPVFALGLVLGLAMIRRRRAR